MANARNYDQIHIVASSTVFPFATSVAEKFGGQFASFKTPIVESTGSGGGIKIFCSGIDLRYPDIVNTSGRIKQSELKVCKEKGITVTEFKIGADDFPHLTSLQRLDLGNNQLENLPVGIFSGLTSLQELSLDTSFQQETDRIINELGRDIEIVFD